MTMLQQFKSDPLSACLLTDRPHPGAFDVDDLKHFAQLFDCCAPIQLC